MVLCPYSIKFRIIPSAPALQSTRTELNPLISLFSPIRTMGTPSSWTAFKFSSCKKENHQNNTVHLSGQKLFDIFALDPAVLLYIAHKRRVAFLQSYIFHTFSDLHIGGIEYVRNDQPYRFGPVEVKTLREPVGLVFFIFYDFLYFFPGFWCNIFRVIQYPGYGSNRNPRGLAICLIFMNCLPLSTWCYNYLTFLTFFQAGILLHPGDKSLQKKSPAEKSLSPQGFNAFLIIFCFFPS